MKQHISKKFKVISIISDLIFFSSILALLYYSTVAAESIRWEMSLPIVLLIFSYFLILKAPRIKNNV
ncbi:hypothetical protein [Alkalihalobacillus sp. R86527]|uniref:hypothetical protein n=1 Tax=Alkalihalobacillus sp. R86527 TaxID=3093863 RepID=UPI003671FB80